MSAKPPRRSVKQEPATNAKPKSKTARKAAKAATAPRATRKSAKSSAAAGKNAKPAQRASKKTEAFYLVVEHGAVRIARGKPSAPAQGSGIATFADAKEQAIDHLIEVIDSFERSLWEIKQAADFAGYEQIVAAR